MFSFEVAAVGFSCRSLVEALSDVNAKVYAVDCFGDQDTREDAAATLVCKSWGPQQPSRSDRTSITDLVRWLNRQAEQGGPPQNFPIFLAGGMESWPELTKQLQANFRIVGPTARQFLALREVELWQDAAAACGIGFPVTTSSPSGGAWLQKSLRSAGGVHVRRLNASSGGTHAPLSRELPRSADTYAQQYIRGRSLGAVWIASPDSRSRGCQLVGVTESLAASDWPGPGEFTYRGSLGPIELRSDQRSQLQRLGETIQRQTGVPGWFQADLIEDENRGLWLLEVNPRWTSGMEIFRLTGSNLLHQHISACQAACFPRKGEVPVFPTSHSSTSVGGKGDNAYAAKAIVYLKEDLLLTEDVLRSLDELPRTHFADIPSGVQLGATLPAGAPLLTVRTRLTRTEHKRAQSADTSPVWQSVRNHLLVELKNLERRVNSRLYGG